MLGCWLTSSMSLPALRAERAAAHGSCNTALTSCGSTAPAICLVRRKGISSGTGSTCVAVPKEYLHAAALTTSYMQSGMHMQNIALYVLSIHLARRCS